MEKPMAITKIYAKRARLDKLIQYVINPDKTDEMTLVSGIGCEVKSAYAEMMQTKEMFHQTDGVQAYHIIQAFSPEEIDVKELQKKLLAEKFYLHRPEFCTFRRKREEKADEGHVK